MCNIFNALLWNVPYALSVFLFPFSTSLLLYTSSSNYHCFYVSWNHDHSNCSWWRYRDYCYSAKRVKCLLVWFSTSLEQIDQWLGECSQYYHYCCYYCYYYYYYYWHYYYLQKRKCWHSKCLSVFSRFDFLHEWMQCSQEHLVSNNNNNINNKNNNNIKRLRFS